MNLVLLNSQSNQQILLDRDNPLIIGRNNVLGCFDKKVSRTHGRITCTENGKINLVALHTNPCFFMKNGVPPVHQLNKDEEETLTEGDCLGLLPNSFWFQLLSVNDVSVKKESESHNEAENSRNLRDDDNNSCEAENTTSGSSDYSKRIGSPEFEKTRRLPLWMYDTDDAKEPDKSASTKNDETGSKRLKLDSGCDKSEGVDIIAKKEVDEGEPSTSKVCIKETLPVEVKIEEGAEKEKGACCTDAEKDKPNSRPVCQYERNCFRKNPQHKLEFSHPGDADYVPYEKRPLCQYAAACYRRSEKHKVEFRHPPGWSPCSSLDSQSSKPSVASSPLPPKRRRKNVTRSSEYEDEDEYDLEDPFINDASSDEYVPTDSNSEDDLDEESRESD